ncbi:LytR/AlgR family response regulator transcription factor [Flagellimonas meridianipacifica]|uniref:DNA-binding LytR/AlgR family response regulator n=1 Tax=Flagellimonas meridianipacifica TaxID=1080225 RepID=A0A2T0MD58_9FLAO|nr:LytTR family DNA-binding domain-containing protein [Allomuricauda pacifica]PRX55403.1 DNA-binding LytR/AlgR family response regulator [Allomuricauda pacifica]
MIKCIIIDDEPLAIGVLNSYCEDLGELNVIASFTNPFEAITLLSKEKIDLVFLDIEMPQINGIDFIKSIDNKPHFIFTTAYSQYAAQGFDLNAVDYLVKPIPFVRFIKAINRVKKLMEFDNLSIKGNENVSPSSGNPGSSSNFLFVKSEYESVKINMEDIKYIQGLKDYLKIHTHQPKPILTLLSFKEIQTKLPSEQFMRVHKSFVVNISKIKSIQRSKIVIDDIRIPIGESFKESFLGRLGL